MNESELAFDYIEYTQRNIIISGKAGTGKTTLLRRIKAETHKNVAVVAPTGVAAINAGGVTIHSFFQLPFNAYVPEQSYLNLHDDILNRERLLSKHKLNKERLEVLRNLELLIIDEISMVRCDVMDMMHIILQHARLNYEQAFGGVQVVMIGDLYQLAPVIKDEEWQKMKYYYAGSYFFDSQVYAELNPIIIELTKIYRQQDDAFIAILNGVRNNTLSDTEYEKLHECLDEYYEPRRDDGAIILTTHNQTADDINMNWLRSLKTKSVKYQAEIQGQFDNKMSPAESILHLKVGAQVMFIKNDLEKVRRYYNGKIARVMELNDDSIIVEDEDGSEIEVFRHTWENIRYEHNAKENKLDEHIIGTFKQFPLRLAWAITIHKSQGLTFDKVVIDAGRAFSPGQVYVSLSRCTQLKGIILKSRIPRSIFKTDERIVHFYQQMQNSSVHALHLQQEKIDYQFNQLIRLFDLRNIEVSGKQWFQLVQENASILNREYIKAMDEYFALSNSLIEIAERFTQELKSLHQKDVLPDENERINLRSGKAAVYFAQQSDTLLLLFQNIQLITDNRMLQTKLMQLHQKLYAYWHKMNALWRACCNGFHSVTLHKTIKAYQTPRLTSHANAQQTAADRSTTLKQMLISLRDELCTEYHLPAYRVATVKTIESLCDRLPRNEAELALISGFGNKRIRQFGAAFLQVIQDYCRLHNIETPKSEVNVLPTKAKKERKIKVSTQAITLQMFLAGKSIDEIAQERKLVRNTIEGHLALAILQKEISAEKLFTAERLQQLSEQIRQMNTGSVTALKAQLPDDVTYGEIRMVLNHLKVTAEKTTV